jgi:hypothetical protein
MRSRAAGVFVLSILLAASVRAATVRGRLVHKNGYPAGYIAVRVMHPQHGASSFAYTGQDGMYYLYNIPGPTISLEIWLSNNNVLRYPINVVEPITDIVPIQVP